MAIAAGVAALALGIGPRVHPARRDPQSGGIRDPATGEPVIDPKTGHAFVVTAFAAGAAEGGWARWDGEINPATGAPMGLAYLTVRLSAVPHESCDDAEIRLLLEDCFRSRTRHD